MDRAFQKHGGHAKAKPFNWAKKALRSLKTMAGRVMRDGGSASASAVSRRAFCVRYAKTEVGQLLRVQVQEITRGCVLVPVRRLLLLEG